MLEKIPFHTDRIFDPTQMHQLAGYTKRVSIPFKCLLLCKQLLIAQATLKQDCFQNVSTYHERVMKHVEFYRGKIAS